MNTFPSEPWISPLNPPPLFNTEPAGTRAQHLFKSVSPDLSFAPQGEGSTKRHSAWKKELGWKGLGRGALVKMTKPWATWTQNPGHPENTDPTPKARMGRELGPEPTRVCPGATDNMVAEVLNSPGLKVGDAQCPAQQDGGARLPASLLEMPPQIAVMSEGMGKGPAWHPDAARALNDLLFSQSPSHAKADQLMLEGLSPKRYAPGNPSVVPIALPEVPGLAVSLTSSEKNVHWDAQEGTDRQDEVREGTREPG